MTKVNPRVEPTAFAHEVAADCQANGGNLTAEEWQFTEMYAVHGWCNTRTQALRMADSDGCIVGGAGRGWRVYRLRK